MSGDIGIGSSYQSLYRGWQHLPIQYLAILGLAAISNSYIGVGSIYQYLAILGLAALTNSYIGVGSSAVPAHDGEEDHEDQLDHVAPH
jgi:hypothetical protein